MILLRKVIPGHSQMLEVFYLQHAKCRLLSHRNWMMKWHSVIEDWKLNWDLLLHKLRVCVGGKCIQRYKITNYKQKIIFNNCLSALFEIFNNHIYTCINDSDYKKMLSFFQCLSLWYAIMYFWYWNTHLMLLCKTISLTTVF